MHIILKLGIYDCRMTILVKNNTFLKFISQMQTDTINENRLN